MAGLQLLRSALSTTASVRRARIWWQRRLRGLRARRPHRSLGLTLNTVNLFPPEMAGGRLVASTAPGIANPGPATSHLRCRFSTTATRRETAGRHDRVSRVTATPKDARSASDEKTCALLVATCRQHGVARDPSEKSVSR